jgi:hypothetical protein
MILRDLLASLFGHRPSPAAAEHVKLDVAQKSIAERLSKLKGGTRDEVLSEAYRRARLLDEQQSYHRERRA